jgi:hypothetical protein
LEKKAQRAWRKNPRGLGEKNIGLGGNKKPIGLGEKKPIGLGRKKAQMAWRKKAHKAWTKKHRAWKKQKAHRAWRKQAQTD